MKKRALAILFAVALILSSTVLYPSAETTKIATFSSRPGYGVATGLTISAAVAVDDNYNFTKALPVKMSSASSYYGATKTSHLYYGGYSSSNNISAWYSNDVAELRFYIKVPHSVTFAIRLQTSTNKGILSSYITVPASDNWQEIRIPKSSFGTDSDFESFVAGTSGSLYVQIRTSSTATADTFLADNEIMYVSQVEFYNGAIEEEVDPNGGTIIPVEGEKIKEYTSGGWNSNGAEASDVTVADNENFTKAKKFTVTDFATHNAANPARVNIYSAGNSATDGISEWATTYYAELRFWIKVPHAVKFTLRFQTESNKAIATNTTISVPASDKWQEIRISRDDFSAGADFNTAVAASTTVYTQIQTASGTTEFLAEDESLYVSGIQFYDGLVPGEIDPDGGTICTHENTTKTDANVVGATYFVDGSKDVVCECGETVQTGVVIPATADALSSCEEEFANGNLTITLTYSEDLYKDIDNGAKIYFNYSIDGYNPEPIPILDGYGAVITLEGFNVDRLNAELTYYLTAVYDGVTTDKLAGDTTRTLTVANDVDLDSKTSAFIDALNTEENTVVSADIGATESGNFDKNTITADLKAGTMVLNFIASDELVAKLGENSGLARTNKITVTIDGVANEYVFTPDVMRKSTTINISGMSFAQLNGRVTIDVEFIYPADTEKNISDTIVFVGADAVAETNTPVANAFAAYIAE